MKHRLLMAGLLVFGGWQIGQSAYMMAKAELAQWLLEQAWDEMQEKAAQGESLLAVPPWPWADTSPMAKLKWQSLNQELIILSGASGRNLAFGPAHLSASVQPGSQGVSVIGGHRDTHFAFLQNAIVGDEFSVELVTGKRYRYQVKEIIITDVRKSRIALNADTSKIALVACYPFSDWQTDSPLRYLVIADYIKAEKIEQIPPTSRKMLSTMG